MVPLPCEASMRVIIACLLFCSAALLASAESATVLGAPAPDQLLVQWHGIPVIVPLAYVADASDGCQAKLEQLAKGKTVELQWLPHFGTTSSGAGRLFISLNDIPLNRSVIEAGLATYQPSTTPNAASDKIIAMAQDKARRAKAGRWANNTTPHTTSPPVVATIAKPASAQKTPITLGYFCAELGSTHYFPAGHKAVASVDSQRLIYYPDEAAAKRAGKLAPPTESAAVAPTLENAERLYQEGRQMCVLAVSKGNSPERDKLYGDAFPKLNQATQIFSVLVEKNPTEDIQDQMRACMQLRYSSIKYRRFE